MKIYGISNYENKPYANYRGSIPKINQTITNNSVSFGNAMPVKDSALTKIVDKFANPFVILALAFSAMLAAFGPVSFKNESFKEYIHDLTTITHENSSNNSAATKPDSIEK